ncbi:MurR/RpiR family transcriptional regulator [Oceanobacillus piezotolerans]|uniref:MurR/RpiR family transcriptional regulator n=1 Tax=Oceanobacillus piezotolerans TaxID=2448030 RepID=A0A498D924_9BACI|nr:MurR/RpiR family transcriptional regulator [Oceanobacillus piezotolerans]RLL43687.1 MurR/RpiR family transcriptional regulator [Oceanobacillus piezotolerans]
MIEFKWNTENMSPNQYKMADYIKKNLRAVLLSTEQEIANALNISIASVSRFWRSVGFKNFKDFKAYARTQLEPSPAGKMENIINQVEEQELQYHSLKVSINHLQKTMEHFSKEAFQQAVHVITGSKKTYIYGQGPSTGLCELFYFRLARAGLELRRLVKGGSELLEDLLHLTKDDVVVIFGFGRILPEEKVIFDYSEEIGYKTIVITDQLVSDFSDRADICLFASRGEMWEFHSMVAPTFMIENLIIAIGMHNKDENLERLEKLSDLRKKYNHDLPR